MRARHDNLRRAPRVVISLSQRIGVRIRPGVQLSTPSSSIPHAAAIEAFDVLETRVQLHAVRGIPRFADGAWGLESSEFL